VVHSPNKASFKKSRLVNDLDALILIHLNAHTYLELARYRLLLQGPEYIGARGPELKLRVVSRVALVVGKHVLVGQVGPQVCHDEPGGLETNGEFSGLK
jgi:hypothetical protein